MGNELINLSVQISRDLDKVIEKMSKDIHESPSDLIKRALFLINIAIDSKKNGNKLAILDGKDHKIGDVVWI